MVLTPCNDKTTPEGDSQRRERKTPVVAIIVAMARNGAIGNENKLLFRLPDDLRRFKAITSGHSIIMGRNTLLSLPRWPLPQRRNIILTTNGEASFEGCETAGSAQEALDLIKGEEEVFIIGGGSVYRLFYPLANRIYLTLVHRDFNGDVFFPVTDFSEWLQTSREDHYDEANDFHYSYINMTRKV